MGSLSPSFALSLDPQDLPIKCLDPPSRPDSLAIDITCQLCSGYIIYYIHHTPAMLYALAYLM